MAEKKLSAAALKKIFWNWFLFNGCSQSGERMQGIAFAQAMTPAIKERTTERTKVSALKRHISYNVDPLGS